MASSVRIASLVWGCIMSSFVAPTGIVLWMVVASFYERRVDAAWSGGAIVILIGVAITLVINIIVGLPISLILRKFDLYSGRNLCLGAVMAGALVAPSIGWILNRHQYSLVWTDLLFGGTMGMVTGLVFHAVVRLIERDKLQS